MVATAKHHNKKTLLHCCIAPFGLEPSVVHTSRTIYISRNLGNCTECAYSWIHTEWMTIALVAHFKTINRAHTKTINRWYHVIALASFCMHAYSSNFHCSQESTNRISLLYESSFVPSMDSMCLWCLCLENCSVIRVLSILSCDEQTIIKSYCISVQNEHSKSEHSSCLRCWKL